jgi:hypothetical protein
MRAEPTRTAPVPSPRPPADTPWLSVLVPVYRVERYLRACVESVLSQGDDGVEVLLLDDGSPDRSWEIAAELARAHPGRVRVFRSDANGGLSAARNRLLEEARGAYVWHLDADDVLLPGAVAGLRRVVARHAPDLVLCDFRVLRERGRWRQWLRGERHRRTFRGPGRRLGRDPVELLDGLLHDGLMHAWSKIGTRALWRQVRFPDGRRLMQDATVVPDLVAAADTYYHAPHAWVGYRRHRASALATLDPAKLHDMLASIRDFNRAACRVPGASGRSRMAIDRCSLRMLASAARRMHAPSPELAQDLRRTCAELFPAGTECVLAHFRQRGWWWRGLRVRRTLGSAGLAAGIPGAVP